jgi:CHAT domain-containing protein/tetratricopeptide (TPR) repeat protein
VVRLSRETPDNLGKGFALLRLGNISSHFGDNQKAIEYLQQALETFRTIPYRRGEAIVLNDLAGIYGDSGDGQKALEFYSQALLIHREVKHRKGEGVTLNNMGLSYYSLDEKEKALGYFMQSLEIRREMKDFGGEATTLNNIGGLYDELGQRKMALEFYKQALAMYRKIDNRDGEATALNNIGFVYSKQGKKRKALLFYQQSLEIRQAIGNKRDEALSLNNIGSLYDALNEKVKALDFFQRSLSIRRQIGDRDGEATTLNNIGGVYSDLGDKEKALDYLNQALPIFRVIGNRADEARVLSNIGFLLEEQSQSELSIVFYKKSVNLYESVRSINRKLSPELIQSYTKTFSKTYNRLADLLIKQGRLPEAQAVLELLKLRELNDYTREARIQPPQGISLSPAEQAALDDILKRYTTINEFATQISRCEESKCAQLSELRNQRDRQNSAVRGALDRLRTTLTTQALDLGKLNTNEFTSKAKEIVNAQPGTILIYPIVQAQKIQFLLAFKAGSGDNAAVTFRSIEGPTIDNATVFKTAQQLREHLSTPDSNLAQLQATSQTLYNWLIKPLEPEINQPNVKHLVFASDKATRYIPLGVLHDGKDYLINKPYTITTILAASETKARSPRPKNPTILALGASVFKTAPNLPYVQQELGAIVQTANNPKGIFPGKQAFNDQFDFLALKDQLANYNFLHIATHGALDPGNVDNSYLLPGKGDNITKDNIQTLHDYGLGNIDLVVLSACNTAVGTSANSRDINASGLELSGLSYYFMKGNDGAKSVLASLWAVSDPSTALMMKNFYTHLSQGKTKAEAIRQAQRDLLNLNSEATTQSAIASLPRFIEPLPDAKPQSKARSQTSRAPGYSHPYYWAPFILIGNSQ